MTFCWLHPWKTTSLDTKIGVPLSPNFPELAYVTELCCGEHSGALFFSSFRQSVCSFPVWKLVLLVLHPRSSPISPGMFQDPLSRLKCSRNALRSPGSRWSSPFTQKVTSEYAAVWSVLSPHHRHHWLYVGPPLPIFFFDDLLKFYSSLSFLLLFLYSLWIFASHWRMWSVGFNIR